MINLSFTVSQNPVNETVENEKTNIENKISFLFCLFIIES